MRTRGTWKHRALLPVPVGRVQNTQEPSGHQAGFGSGLTLPRELGVEPQAWQPSGGSGTPRQASLGLRSDGQGWGGSQANNVLPVRARCELQQESPGSVREQLAATPHGTPQLADT